MKIIAWSVLFFLSVLLACQTPSQPNLFVKVKNGGFERNNKLYVYAGVNYWQASYLASLEHYGNREVLLHDLDVLQNLGVKNIRIQIASEADSASLWTVKPGLLTAPDVYNEKVFAGIDFLLNELAARDMTAIMVLNNYWSWSGGMSKYIEWFGGEKIPFPNNEEPNSWGKYMDFTARFYEIDAASAYFRKHIAAIVNRKNTYNGLTYKFDPTIMAWQLANEPRGGKSDEQKQIFRKWLQETASYIKSLDSIHLVSTGSEGSVGHHMDITAFEAAHNSPNIDYLTIHIWPQNWQWYNPMQHDSSFANALVLTHQYIDAHLQVALKLNKPLVLEEFGLARDLGSFEPSSGTQHRNAYIDSVYNYIFMLSQKHNVPINSNIWGYSGSLKPSKPMQFWEMNDPLIGDSPHELQGWYSIYNSDSTTLNKLVEMNRRLELIINK